MILIWMFVAINTVCVVASVETDTFDWVSYLNLGAALFLTYQAGKEQ